MRGRCALRALGLLVLVPLLAAPDVRGGVTAKKAPPPSVTAKAKKTTGAVSHTSKTAHPAEASPAAAKGKKARVPRTLRMVPVSPMVRGTAVERVEANLAESASSPFTYPEALGDFLHSLADAQAERSAGGASSRTVRVLQFGDSHTAADIFTGEMRARMQEQFGDGGLGFQFPGHPFAGYHLAGSVRSQSAGWLTEGNRFTQLGNGDLGLGGISIATTLAGQTARLEVAGCETLQLHYLRQAGGGRLQFSDNGTPISIVDTANDTASWQSETSRAGTLAYACVAGPHVFEVTTLDHAPVKLLGIVTEQPGVTWECLGINGAVAPLLLRWNQALFGEYLRQREPSLIVLAYGTNEAGSGAERLESYPAELARVLETLHLAAPEASVLIIGPEDRAVSSGRGRRAAWHPLTGTSRIIAMQKEACRAHGCAFWDARRRMGGLGSMPQWVAAGWAQPDRTHLTGTGYRALADALYADLIRAYNLYQQHTAAGNARLRGSLRVAEREMGTMSKREGILKVLHAVAEKDLTPGEDESLFTSGLLDSFALTDFVVGLEKEFLVKIPDADMTARKFDTLHKVEEYLATKGV